MNCPFCDVLIQGTVKNCPQCGHLLPVYGAPPGFSFDKSFGQYYQITMTHIPDEGSVKCITWFDPMSGQYRLDHIPVVRPVPNLPETKPDPLPVESPVEDVAKSDPQPTDGDKPVSFSVPEGFTEDPGSGLYFRLDASRYEERRQALYTTWYDRGAGEYAQVKYLSRQPAVPEPAKPPAVPQHVKKSRPLAVALVVILTLVLLAGLGLGGHFLGYYSIPLIPQLERDVPTVAPIEDDVPDEPIDWKEPAVEKAVREYLNISPDEPIYPSQLDGIQAVSFVGDRYAINSIGDEPENVPQGTIKSLADISHFTNLESLQIIYQEIEDISPVADMTGLVKLSLHSNRISDISPLKNLRDLESVALGSNRIADLSALDDLKKLRELYLHNNRIEDISPLAGLTELEVLVLDQNNIVDATPVSGLKHLTRLGLADNRITDVSPLKDLTGLMILTVNPNPVADWSPLENLTAYKPETGDDSPLYNGIPVNLTGFEADYDWNRENAPNSSFFPNGLYVREDGMAVVYIDRADGDEASLTFTYTLYAVHPERDDFFEHLPTSNIVDDLAETQTGLTFYYLEEELIYLECTENDSRTANPEGSYRLVRTREWYY